MHRLVRRKYSNAHLLIFITTIFIELLLPNKNKEKKEK